MPKQTHLTKDLLKRHQRNPLAIRFSEIEHIDDEAAWLLPRVLRSTYPIGGRNKTNRAALIFLSLKNLSAQAARGLARHNGYLGLSAVTELSDAAARALCRHRGHLQLGGLRTISEAGIALLSLHRGQRLSSEIRGLIQSSRNERKKLGEIVPVSIHEGRALWEEIPHFRDRFVRITTVQGNEKEADEKKKPLIRKIKQLETVAQTHEYLCLAGLTQLSERAAIALSSHVGNLNLNGVTDLTASAAHALATHRGVLHLFGLTRISDESAHALAKLSGKLHLNPRVTYSSLAAKVLAKAGAESSESNG